MATKPTEYLNWNPSLSAVVDPPSPLKVAGWAVNEEPPAQYFNWLFNLLDQWVQYFDEAINVDVSTLNLDQTMRLINGGNWKWVLGSGTLSWSSAFNLAIPSIPDANNQAAAGSIVLADGEVAYVAANVPFTTTGDTTNLSDILSNLAYVNGITVGMTVTGSNIPGGTTITAVDTTLKTATMSASATGTATAENLTFSGVGALTVAAATSSSLLPAPNTVIVARRVGSLVFVGVNSGQMVMRDGEQNQLLQNGMLNVWSGTAGENLSANEAVYVSDGTGGDSGRTAGRAYKLDPSVSNGASRHSFIGFVLTAATTGNPVSVVGAGRMVGFTSLTVGHLYYGDPATPGAVTDTVPTTSGQYVVPVGMAVSTTELLVNSALGANAAVVATPNAWPEFFATTEAELATAITAASSAGGGVIGLLNSFTISSAHTLPANTILQGRSGATILTLASSGAITLSQNSEIRDTQLTTALTSGSMVVASSNYAKVRGCQLTIPTNSTGQAILVSGNANKFYSNTFIGVSGADTGYGINYSAGTGNEDYDSVFIP
jgi:hypothetical protein